MGSVSSKGFGMDESASEARMTATHAKNVAKTMVRWGRLAAAPGMTGSTTRTDNAQADTRIRKA
jgi:hypothetical protein